MENTNIVEMHLSILKSFEEEGKQIPELQMRIEELRQTNNVVPTTSQIKQLEGKLRELETKSNFYFYYLEAQPIIDAFKVEMTRPVQLSFMGSARQVDTQKRDELVAKYHKLASRFRTKFSCPSAAVQVSKPSTQQKQQMECKHCKQQNAYVINNDNVCACEHCGTEQDMLLTTFSYRDAERVNVYSKYQYDRRVHFRECINQFQGKQSSTIKQDIYDRLHDQIRLHGLVPANVSKRHILLLLKEIGSACHYEDLNLIHHNITGTPLPDISHLEDMLIADFDKLSRLYDDEYIKTRRIERKNFINIQYVLFQLLRRHKYPCSHTDFSFLKTIERKEFHDDICSHLFRLLGWNFQPII